MNRTDRSRNALVALRASTLVSKLYRSAAAVERSDRTICLPVAAAASIANVQLKRSRHPPPPFHPLPIHQRNQDVIIIRDETRSQDIDNNSQTMAGDAQHNYLKLCPRGEPKSLL